MQRIVTAVSVHRVLISLLTYLLTLVVQRCSSPTVKKLRSFVRSDVEFR